jgi:energy-coupling factor transporter ATP-binding protein EcfA2
MGLAMRNILRVSIGRFMSLSGIKFWSQAPATILTGPEGCGKTSVVKAMAMLWSGSALPFPPDERWRLDHTWEVGEEGDPHRPWLRVDWEDFDVSPRTVRAFYWKADVPAPPREGGSEMSAVLQEVFQEVWGGHPPVGWTLPTPGPRPAPLQDAPGWSRLSDIVVDLVFRCWDADCEAPRQVPGIVVIDDLERGLHPARQQTILRGLTRAFPKLTWLVTSTSPIILSSVGRECVRSMGVGDPQPPVMHTLGADYSDILQGLLGVNPKGQDGGLLLELEQLVAERRYEDARPRLKALKGLLGDDHNQLLRLEKRMGLFLQIDERMREKALSEG